MNQLPNLLIVDDTAENLILLAALIGKINVNLIKASSGAVALEKTRGIELALAIIDVRMPVMDGYELAMKLNEERVDDKVPVIFLTANYYNENELFKGYDSGAVDYIFKPLNSKILLSKISVFIDLFNQKQKIISDAKLLKTSTDELIQTINTLKNREEKLEQEQIFNKALLDSIPGIFYLFTYPDLRMISWNKQHETLFGFKALEMRGQHVLEWNRPETRETILNSLVTFMDSGQTSFKTSLMAKDGRLIPFLLTCVKFESQGQIYLIGIGTEITEMIIK